MSQETDRKTDICSANEISKNLNCLKFKETNFDFEIFRNLLLTNS